MKQQDVFKRLGGILTELTEQYDYLKTIEGPLNELELELFLANSNFLTDHVLILSKLNAQNSAAAAIAPVTQPPVVVEPKVETPAAPVKNYVAPVTPPPVIVEPKPETPPAVTQNYFEPLVSVANTGANNKLEEKPANENSKQADNPEPSIHIEPANEDSYSFMHEDEPETIRHELVLDEADMDDEDETYTTEFLNDENEEADVSTPPISTLDESKAEIEAEPVKETTPEPVIKQPKFEQPEPVKAEPQIEVLKEQPKQPEVLSINDRISAQIAAKNGVADQLHGQPITDLKQAISLNDKLLFVKDLFNGYSLAYSEAIEILNRFKSFVEAEQFLKNNYITKNNWDSKPETTEKFYAILKRRYA